MAQTKFPLPIDIKQETIAYIRGYDRRKNRYLEKRKDIMYASISRSSGQTVKSAADITDLYILLPKGSKIADPTANMAERLDWLERSPETQKILAVERAKEILGVDIPNQEIRESLLKAVWISYIESGRAHPYEFFYIPTVGRDRYYEYRREFLWLIAREARLIEIS